VQDAVEKEAEMQQEIDALLEKNAALNRLVDQKDSVCRELHQCASFLSFHFIYLFIHLFIYLFLFFFFSFLSFFSFFIFFISQLPGFERRDT
jgi:hypothetical protein